MGLRIKLGQHVYDQYGYLAGKDTHRLADFHQMVADRNIKAIIFARGGYGTGRFIDKLDMELIKKIPKLSGDTAILHFYIQLSGKQQA